MAAADGVEVDTFLVAKVRRAPPLKGRGDPPHRRRTSEGGGNAPGGRGEYSRCGGGEVTPEGGWRLPRWGGNP